MNARILFTHSLARGTRLAGVGVLLFLLAGGGCVKSMIPGDLHRVQIASDAPKAGNVYLLRGWIGIFSYGVDGIGRETNEHGIRASVYQDDQWATLAAQLRAKYKDAKNPEPLVLIGHSYGADDVVNIARELKKDAIPVDLLVTLDPVTPPLVPSNVKWCYNLYQSNGFMDNLPFLRGIALTAEPNFHGKLENVDIRKDRTDLLEPGLDHFNIEKKAKIHGEIQAVLQRACPPREQWVREHPAQLGWTTPKMASASGGGSGAAPARSSRTASAKPSTQPVRQSAARSDDSPF